MDESRFSAALKAHGYDLIKEIGRGGYSLVYLVKSIKYNSEFCAKLILNQSRKGYSQSEIDILIRLSHQNIIRFYESFNIGEMQVIILEYCPNGSMGKMLDGGEQCPLQQFYSFAIQIASAIKYIHGKGIAHCDIKLDNILLDSYGRPKISDFGISQMSEAGTKITKFAGSMPYMAPEVINKQKYDPFAADIWSLGVTLFCILFKKMPWTASEPNEIMNQITTGVINYPSNINDQLYNLFEKMLCISPAKRCKIDQVLASLESQKEQFVPKELLQKATKPKGEIENVPVKAMRPLMTDQNVISQKRRGIPKDFVEKP